MIREGIPVSSGRPPVMRLCSVKTDESARPRFITPWNSAASLEINSAENQKGDSWRWHTRPKFLFSCFIASAGRRGGEDEQASLRLLFALASSSLAFALQWVKGFTSNFPVHTGPQRSGLCIQETHVQVQSGLVESLGADPSLET